MVPPPPGQGQGEVSQPQSTSSVLVPLSEWLALHPGPITFQVQCPPAQDHFDAKWQLQGQLLPVEMSLAESCASLKERLTSLIPGMLPGKMKLQKASGMLVKDAQTLAEVNVAPGETLYLKVKERGGRRR